LPPIFHTDYESSVLIIEIKIHSTFTATEQATEQVKQLLAGNERDKSLKLLTILTNK